MFKEKNRASTGRLLVRVITRMVIILVFIFTVAMVTDHLLRRHDPAYASGMSIVINEVEHNPEGVDSGEEWVEIYNPTGSEVSLAGWTLSTTAGKALTLPLSGSVPTGGYLVIVYGAEWLANGDESLLLRDSGGNVVDSTPVQSDTADDDRCWGRHPDGGSTWSFGGSTKGAPNGEPIPELGLFLACVVMALYRRSFRGLERIGKG